MEDFENPDPDWLDDPGMYAGGEEEEKENPKGLKPAKEAKSAKKSKASKASKSKPSIPKENGQNDDTERWQEFDDDGKAFFGKIVNRFPKSTIWFFLALCLCAVRASHTFIIIIAWVSVLFWIIQAAAWFIPKGIGKYVSFVFYGFDVILYFLMFGEAFIKG